MTNVNRELTFKHNINKGRHGWLRLTPAYSVKLVQHLIDKHPELTHVLDPFSGTGTTGLVCGENGINCDLIDINPFLTWFATAKTRNYSQESLNSARYASTDIVSKMQQGYRRENLWYPPLSNIDRWWIQDDLIFLANLRDALFSVLPDQTDVRDLMLIAFCRLTIDLSNAAFNHQSMSFSSVSDQSLRTDSEITGFFSRFVDQCDEVVSSAQKFISGRVGVMVANSRDVPIPNNGLYDAVITSPPYPNRMSYIRELRPYMYWLKYLSTAREAGELDWLAIGGTWGIATSRVGTWKPLHHDIDFGGFNEIISTISQRSELLARYVHKYFVDILQHLESLYPVLATNARVYYIVGNSKFYDTLVPVEQIYAHLLRQVGFENVVIETIRKRNSKKELFEFCVSGMKPPRAHR